MVFSRHDWASPVLSFPEQVYIWKGECLNDLSYHFIIFCISTNDIQGSCAKLITNPGYLVLVQILKPQLYQEQGRLIRQDDHQLYLNLENLAI